MLGGWVSPHREQQTIRQCQTSIPPKSFSTPTAKARHDQAALAASAEARGATHRARAIYTHTYTHTPTHTHTCKSLYGTISNPGMKGPNPSQYIN